MAVAFLQELPGATQEQYDQVVETLRGQTAEGRIFHVAGPIGGGWRIVDVWESQEAVNKFFQEQLGPAAQAAGMALRHRSSGLSTTCSVGQSIPCSLQAKGAGLSTPFSGSQVRA
jgi:hypothetical protein